MRGERLELITDFATLRAGMIVVCRSCGCCGREHRTIITNIGDCPRDGTCFVIRPSPCLGEELHIGPSAVKAGRVWRVIDGLENEQSQATTKKLERVK